MKNKNLFFHSFYVKVAASFILSLLFVALLGNLIFFKYSLKSHFNQLRDKLKAIVQTAAVSIDAEQLNNIPLNADGVDNISFKGVAIQLLKIKQANPLIRYIYIMKKTDQQGILQFVVDPDALTEKITRSRLTSYPGDKYNANRFPEMLKAFGVPSIDTKLVLDEWGRLLSGYAPIFDKDKKPFAILGIDMDASDVYATQRGLLLRGIFVLFMGIIFSLGLGFIFSARIINPIKKLIDGTKHIGAGDLRYRVKISSQDEIGRLAESFNNMAINLADAREKLHDYFYRVVQAMVRSLEAKDSYTRGHSDRVSEYSYKIAIEMGIPQEKAQLLRKAAQLHDIGKLGVNEGILNKKSSLSKEEWDVVHKHPEIGEEILKPVLLDAQMLSVIRSHHERYDGKGYPDGLTAEQTNIFSQIVSVADAYDAITSSRSYRAEMGKEEALARLTAGAGTQFNPAVVQAFVSILKRAEFNKD